jgi:F0F1-type ATP synthase epsilon subunit
MKSTLAVVLRQRKGVLYKGAAEAVTAINEVGEFDILENHAQFVGLIKDMVTVRHNGGYKRTFALKSGILTVQNNVVKVFFDI